MQLKTQNQDIITPLKYFGQRESIVEDLFNFLPSRKYRACFDPFSGSGSISFAAMRKEIANEYYINDSFPILALFWEIIKLNPNEVLNNYQKIYSAYRNSEQKQVFYQAIQKEFNSAINKMEVVSHFAFLINHAKDNLPLFDEGLNLKCEAGAVELTQEQDATFKFRVLTLSEIFNTKKVIFSGKHFEEVLQDATSEDLVLLDPPYPAQSSEIYHHLKDQEQLQKNLVACMDKLNQRKIPFIILYGAGPIDKKYYFPAESLHLTHLVRLSFHPLHGKFLEHVYVSNHVGLTKLPTHIVPYNDIFTDSSSYEDTLDNLIKKLTVSGLKEISSEELMDIDSKNVM